jgi:peptidoglycan/xylan/chitin deacetylase (PgdA/CDA1 family)
MVAVCGGSIEPLDDGTYEIQKKASQKGDFDKVDFSGDGAIQVNVQYNITRIRDYTGALISPSEPGWVYLTDYQYNWGSLRDILNALGLAIKQVDDNPNAQTTTVTIQDNGATSPPADTSYTREYGEPGTYVDADGIYGYMVYPVTGQDAVDNLILGWLKEYHGQCADEMNTARKTYPNIQGELSFQYNSYLLDNKYAGIELDGYYYNTGMPHPQAPVKTFNVNTLSGRLIPTNQIVTLNADVYTLLGRKILQQYPGEADNVKNIGSAWFSNIVLTHNGIDVLLERGSYLSAALGTVRISLSRAELGAAFVLGQAASNSVDPAKPMVALTFDDGPSQYTSDILALLDQYDGQELLTFCQVGQRIAEFPDAEKDIVAHGCQVINHSWDHAQLTTLSVSAIRDELNQTNDAIEKAVGIRPRFFRPPYGSTNAAVLQVAKEMGMTAINWSIDPQDWKSRNADSVYNEVMGHTYNGAIILCHDLYQSTATAMERVIPALINKGYQLVTVDQLLQYSDKDIEPGKVIYQQ